MTEIAAWEHRVVVEEKPGSPTSVLGAGDWRQRLAFIVEMMRDMSRHQDPQAMVRSYAQRMRQITPADRWISLSRRGLEFPWYRITRSSTWSEEINPWREKDRLPLLQGGLLADLIYAEEPRLIDDLTDLWKPDDPAAAYLAGQRSLMAMPHFDNGVGLNMVVMLRQEPAAWDPERFPEIFWLSSLFGRATKALVLSDELKQAYAIVERELKVVADIQRSLLPRSLPEIPGCELAAHYQTSQWAGGDYYDFFELPGGRWGILIADVSGHGTPAAVMMAILHSLAHGHPGHPDPPAALLEHVNHRLAARYTMENEVFVTAFYGVYDPHDRQLTYSSAGHNPPLLKRCAGGPIVLLEEAGGPPLGLFDEVEYPQGTLQLASGDVLVFYTDGITEAMNDRHEQFGLERLNAAVIPCDLSAHELVGTILEALARFTGSALPVDDRTLLVARLT